MLVKYKHLYIFDLILVKSKHLYIFDLILIKYKYSYISDLMLLDLYNLTLYTFVYWLLYCEVHPMKSNNNMSIHSKTYSLLCKAGRQYKVVVLISSLNMLNMVQNFYIVHSLFF